MSIGKSVATSADDSPRTVTATVDGGVARLVFANSAQRGALTPEMLRSLRTELRSLERGFPDLRVVLLSGAGDTFSSGYAIDRIPEPDELAVADEIEELCRAIEASPLVVIAVLRGSVIGAALDVAAACDFRLAATDTRLGITPAKLGVVYTMAGTGRIHRLVGPDWARMLFFTGDLIDAERAAAIGLVTQRFGATELSSEADRLAHRIACRAPLSLRGGKRMLRAVEAAADPDRATVELLHELRKEALRSPDSAEARAAFAAKRRPIFTGKQAR